MSGGLVAPGYDQALLCHRRPFRLAFLEIFCCLQPKVWKVDVVLAVLLVSWALHPTALAGVLVERALAPAHPWGQLMNGTGFGVWARLSTASRMATFRQPATHLFPKMALHRPRASVLFLHHLCCKFFTAPLLHQAVVLLLGERAVHKLEVDGAT